MKKYLALAFVGCLFLAGCAPIPTPTPTPPPAAELILTTSPLTGRPSVSAGGFVVEFEANLANHDGVYRLSTGGVVLTSSSGSFSHTYTKGGIHQATVSAGGKFVTVDVTVLNNAPVAHPAYAWPPILFGGARRVFDMRPRTTPEGPRGATDSDGDVLTFIWTAWGPDCVQTPTKTIRYAVFAVPCGEIILGDKTQHAKVEVLVGLPQPTPPPKPPLAFSPSKILPPGVMTIEVQVFDSWGGSDTVRFTHAIATRGRHLVSPSG